jgi:hypothetical protein
MTTDDPDEIIGEAQQEWHLWRRRYNLFLRRDDAFQQFARIDTRFLGKWPLSGKLCESC